MGHFQNSSLSTKAINANFVLLSSDRLQLIVSDVSHSVEGNYSVTATNPAGSSSKTVEVIVEGMPACVIFSYKLLS